MALRYFYQRLSQPLSPRLDAWVRRVFGTGQAVLACLLGAFAVRLIWELRSEITEAHAHAAGVSDAGGAAFAVVVYGLIPATGSWPSGP